MEVHLLDVREVAELLHISRSYAYLLIRRGEIPSFRLGAALRVHPSDVELYLARTRRPLKGVACVAPSSSARPVGRLTSRRRS